MRRLGFVLFTLCVGAGFGCGGCVCPSRHGYKDAADYRRAEAESRQKKAQPVIDAIEKYNTAHGKYPSSLDDLVTEKLLTAIPDLTDTNDHLGQPGRIARATGLRYVRIGEDGIDDYSLEFGYGFVEQGWMGAGAYALTYHYSWNKNNAWTSVSQRPPERYLPRTLTVQHKGRNAEEWGRDLLSDNEQVSLAAAEALRAIGAEGLRFVFEGIRASSPAVRERSIRVALDTELARKYPNCFLPELKSRLWDTHSNVTVVAAKALVQSWSPDAVIVKLDISREIESRMKGETNPQVKQELADALELLTKR